MTQPGLARRLRGRPLRACAAVLGTALAVLLAVDVAFPKPRALPEVPEAIPVAARPITSFRPGQAETRFGSLDFRGGLVLSSSFSGFGGLSGFALSPDSRFVAVSDAGVLFTGRLDTDGDRPVGLSDVQAAALKDQKGGLLALRGRGDAEALALTPDALYVALETINEIWRYPLDALGANGRVVPVAAIRRLRLNTGIESLAYVPVGPLKGALIAIAEEGDEVGGDLPGFIVGEKGQAQGFTIAKSWLFDATDLAITAEGEMFLLERHYSITTGVLMQVRRFALAEVKPGAHLTGTVLGRFDMGHEIDNMEGLAVTRNAKGETLLTMVSDDNFSMLQRTILLRFAVVQD